MELENYIISCETISDLDRDEILSRLDVHQFCVIRGLIKPDALQIGEEVRSYIEGTEVCALARNQKKFVIIL